ncbi:hypothetical protein [Paenibacillus crassostreae]|uniref:Uncharacterized protein n=1 Tax=Paenibacillus crassostreae TaxID=1763538 RepID=A0A167GC55_9BACL|nr:hypothetical protein [Paenibacillus crassostreae]AOZ92663.1 hypothetical protein LPB68_10825 [Paenibacillus crassostreae]OAB77432.1 hypothetical protein PNBC_01820 [Paenibacillus crassostreae]
MSRTTKLRKRATQLKSRPVCITLHDGRSYVGWITGLEKQALILSGQRNHRKPNRNSHSRSQKATISGLMPLFGSLLGNGGAAGGAVAGGLGFIGMMQKSWPLMKMGYSMIKSIMPFLGSLKGLMA